MVSKDTRCLKGGWEKEAGKSSTAKRHMEESEKQRDEDKTSGDGQCSREEDRKQQHTVSKKRPHVHVIYYSKYILKRSVQHTLSELNRVIQLSNLSENPGLLR